MAFWYSDILKGGSQVLGGVLCLICSYLMHSVNHLPDPCFPLFFGCQEAQSQISGSLQANVQDFNACILCCPPRGFTLVSHPSFPGAWTSCLSF